MKVSRDITIGFNELNLKDGTSVSDALDAAHRQILELGQELGLKRQQEYEENSHEWEEFQGYEGICWSVLNTLEKVQEG
jgi:hypothetical protein